MIESLKTKLWNLLETKEVSLAMLYNKDGDILWHKGRDIKGKTVFKGEGFSKTYIQRSMTENVGFDRENVTLDSSSLDFSRSAYLLNVKALIIQPVGNGFFLYIDSGTRNSFNETDREVFKIIGQLLGLVISRIRKSQTRTGGITGNSKEIKHIRELALKYSLEEAPILLLGDTGVGKSHIARLIHEYSGRKGEFITVNTPGIPETLFESEVFGHKKGSFTGAGSDKRGFVDEAEHGTLFFDEISEVPASFQAKFLRFIESRRFQVLGDPVDRLANVRIIAATNKDLVEAISKKEFREDLYYRLQVLEIKIPALRHRKEDLKALVQENLNYLKGKEIEGSFWEAVSDHDWPGNVRELITVLTRAGILLDSPVTGEGIRDIINYSHVPGRGVGDEKADKINQLFQQLEAGSDFWEVIRKPFLNHDFNREQIKEFMSEAMRRFPGNYKTLLGPFHIKARDYKKFLNFINDNNLKP